MKQYITIFLFLILLFSSCDFISESSGGQGLTIFVTDDHGNPISDVGLHFSMDMQNYGYNLHKSARVSDIGLGDFEIVEQTDSTTTLQWYTEFESNCQGFLIYRSSPGEDSVLIASWENDSSLVCHGTSEAGDLYSYTDKSSVDNYIYYLFYQDSSGSILLLGQTISVIIPPHIIVPHEYQLRQNYPNPFNPTTTITLAIAKAGPARLVIVDRFDNHIITKLFEDEKKPGIYKYLWDGKTDAGTYVTNNVYKYILQTPDITIAKTLFVNMQDPEHIKSLNSIPLASSNQNGMIQIAMKKLPVDQKIIHTDENGNELGSFRVPENLNIILIKEGYQTHLQKIKINPARSMDIDVILKTLP